MTNTCPQTEVNPCLLNTVICCKLSQEHILAYKNDTPTRAIRGVKLKTCGYFQMANSRLTWVCCAIDNVSGGSASISKSRGVRNSDVKLCHPH